MKKIIIIGGGLSGLSASCYLAKDNFDVTLIDKNSAFGGRLTSFQDNGFIFDMGPTWYWMPDVFENFFNNFGKNISDYYYLTRLNPSYKFFHKNCEFNIPLEIEKLYELFENIEPGSKVKLKKFMKQARIKYELSMQNFIRLPNNSIKEYISLPLIKNMFSLDLLKSLRKHVSYYFQNKVLRDLLEFPSMFLGGSPNNTPALYTLMNYADIALGTWYPIGGMSKVSDGFLKLSKELGVRHILNQEIVNFKIKNNEIINAVTSKGNTYEADKYLCCAEYPYVQTNLLEEKYRTYTPDYWSSKNIAPSALIFYLGTSCKINNIEHHNIFFDRDFDSHLNDIFVKNIWPKDPLFYVCCPSKTDFSIVPDDNKENIFILIPIASDSVDTEEIRENYYIKIISRIEKITGQSIRDKVITKHSFCINDFKNKYYAYKGNAYGLANTLFQTAFLKPKIKDNKIKNLYYSGHFTVPGPGLPPAIISGEIVSKQIIKDEVNEANL